MPDHHLSISRKSAIYNNIERGNGVLQDAGKVVTEIAKLHVLAEFAKYRVVQDHSYMSDYDRFILELEGEKDDSEKEVE